MVPDWRNKYIVICLRNFCKTTAWIKTSGGKSSVLTKALQGTNKKRGPNKKQVMANYIQPLLAALLMQHFEKGGPNKTAGWLEHGPYKNHRVPNKEKDAFQSTGFLCYLRYLLLSLSVVFCFQAPLLIKLLMLHKMLILLTHIWGGTLFWWD